MPDERLRVLAVVGSPRRGSVIRIVLNHAADRLRADGCDVDVLDLGTDPLPAYNPDTSYDQPWFPVMQERLERADVFILGSPDYHGSITAALKNFLDHFWHEFAGKLIVPVVASHEKGLTVIDQLRTITRQCYAWAMPYGVSCADNVDVKDGRIVSDAFKQRFDMMVRDSRIYGQVLAKQRRADLAGSEPGFMARRRE